MPKEAITMICIVEESHEATNEQIEMEIRKEAKIPWCRQIKNVTIKMRCEKYAKIKGKGLQTRNRRENQSFIQNEKREIVVFYTVKSCIVALEAFFLAVAIPFLHLSFGNSITADAVLFNKLGYKQEN
jgi:hypothetical protein